MEKKVFYSKIFKLVLPIVLQNLLSAAVSSADVIMLNYVSQASISAVSLATQYSSVLFMVYYGLGTGATMLCAQYYGKGDMKAIQLVEGIALRFSVSISMIFALCSVCIPKYMMMVFTKDAELIAIGSSYLRVVSISFLCWGFIEVYLSVLRSTGKVMISMALNVSALVLNVLLNGVFIFGLFGAPKLGAAGVALATTISRVVELLLCCIVSAKMKEVKLKPSLMFHKGGLLFKDFVRLSLPALGNDVAWGLAFSMYSVIMGHMGTDVVAANSIVVVVRNFGTVFCYGLASAGGILLGNEIGENKLEQAKVDAKRVIRLTIISGALGGLLIFLVTPFVLRYAALTETAMYYLKYMLYINVYYIMGAAVNTTMIAGVFRAGGDSRFGFVCDVIDMWVYAVPLGFLAAFVFKLPVMWVYFLLCTDEFVKWPFVIKHYRSYKWLKNITRDEIAVSK
ncbi:MATE family efflux transporter [Lachnospiraceae bacterium OttesenSCG-928-D06]|nr:MATE family efflux transporter [Lachnospiraceae bacterium OttesenSCG-928-D06]